MRRLIIGIILLILFADAFGQENNITISGYIKEKGSGELLIGVNIYLKGTQTGTVSNTYGFYSLTIPQQKADLVFSYVGYIPQNINKHFGQDTIVNISLNSNIELSEVEIVGNREARISDKAEMSVVSVPVKQIREIPALLGEKDVFKVMQLLPGIRSGSEASAGLYVRGGGPDQNLVILDEATVYNAMHLFGFFSVFNGDAIKSVELYKGGFPARYGGRLSSVIEMNLKDGNKEEFGGEGSIGILSSRLLLEGPIKKRKSSFIISGRRTYIDVLARPIIQTLEEGTVGYYFYDLNAKVNYEISDKDKLYLSGYFGRDKFYSSYDDANYSDNYNLFWENATSTLRWNHQFSNKLFSNTSFIFSKYQFVIDFKEEGYIDDYHLNYKSGIRDLGLKNDYSWIPSPDHYIRTGFAITNHLFTPSAIVIEGDFDDEKFEVQELNSIETAVYAEDEWRALPNFKINAGLRFSNFNHKEKSYFGLEPRLLASYMLTDRSSIKASYTKMNQYIHLLTSSGIGLPTDLWVPATDRIGPQNSQQFAIGLTRDFDKPSFALSIEGYYKTMNNIISYNEGASFLLIDEPDATKDFNYEDAVTVGDGYSYGMEVLAQRKYGKLTGWIGYTLSYTKYQFDELNNGKEFFPRHDRRHDFSIVGIYTLSKKITLSATWVYGTGDAITLAQSEYRAYTHDPLGASNNSQGVSYFNSKWASYYGEKNSFRMAAYHRLDVGAQFSKKLKWGGVRTFELSLYNMYNRQNPFYYYSGTNYDENGSHTVLKQVSLFPILPGIAYYLKF